MNLDNRYTLSYARNLAVEQRNGRELTTSERGIIEMFVTLEGPEAFYMDGELFA